MLQQSLVGPRPNPWHEHLRFEDLVKFCSNPSSFGSIQNPWCFCGVFLVWILFDDVLHLKKKLWFKFCDFWRSFGWVSRFFLSSRACCPDRVGPSGNLPEYPVARSVQQYFRSLRSEASSVICPDHLFDCIFAWLSLLGSAHHSPCVCVCDFGDCSWGGLGHRPKVLVKNFYWLRFNPLWSPSRSFICSLVSPALELGDVMLSSLSRGLHSTQVSKNKCGSCIQVCYP